MNPNYDHILENIGDEEDVIKMSPLQELSHDLIEESIKDQIDNPFMSHTNFVQEFMDEYTSNLDDLDGNDDAIAELSETAHDFFIQVLEMIDKKFKLDLDFEVLGEVNVKGLMNIVEGLYEFFIIRYQKNISKYVTALTIDYKDELLDRVSSDDDKDTVSYASFDRKLNNAKDGILISNINLVFDALKDLDISNDDFIRYFNEDKYEVAITKYCIENFIISGDFVKMYLDPIFGFNVQNDIYDDVVTTVRHNLYMHFKKDDGPKLEDYQPEEGDK